MVTGFSSSFFASSDLLAGLGYKLSLKANRYLGDEEDQEVAFLDIVFSECF